VEQVGAAVGAVDLLAHAQEVPLDLLVQLDPVGDDKHARVRHVLADPARQPDHGQRLAGALRVPDDAPFAAADVRLAGAHCEVLVGPADLLAAGIEGDEVVDQLQQPRRIDQPQQRAVQRGRAARAAIHGQVLRAGCAGPPAQVLFLPGQVLLFGGLDDAVAQPFGVVAGHDELDGGEEVADEGALLVAQVLADALADRHGGPLELQHAQRNAVDVERQVGPLARLALDRDLLGHGEVVAFRVLPIHQPDGLRGLAGLLDLDPVAQQLVDRAVGVVEAAPFAQRGGLLQLVQRAVNRPLVVAALFQPGAQQRRLDVAVVRPVGPVPQVGVAELVAQQADDAILDEAFFITDVHHAPRDVTS